MRKFREIYKFGVLIKFGAKWFLQVIAAVGRWFRLFAANVEGTASH
ncbi:MAG: hypothetical protein ACE5HX_19605 [bacterium]